jgi:hypothetical protein
MHQLISEIIAGKKCDVEAVEALLLLSEWEPQDSLSEGKEIGCGEEDRAAWMHVGLALRIGYFLGLDRTAIKHDDEDKAAHFNRRRVTWAGETNLPLCYSSLTRKKLVTSQIGSYLLELAVLFGLEGQLHLLVSADTVHNSMTFVLFNRKPPKTQIMPAFYRQILILLNCSATSMMSCTLEWGAV